MKIEIIERPRKMVICWMTKEECSDKELSTSLSRRFTEWKENKYTTVIFESGTKDIENSMYLLMKRNYQIMANKVLPELTQSRERNM